LIICDRRIVWIQWRFF